MTSTAKEPNMDETPKRPGDETSLSSGDDAILPEGQIDPVYEKKARVLNRAVSHH
jgi:hypothetical protein